jgi:conjugal transfer pilus assembly protein TraB
MTNLEHRINQITAKIKQYFAFSEEVENQDGIKKKQNLNKFLLSLLIIGVVALFLLYLASPKQLASNNNDTASGGVSEKSKTIELGLSATKGEVKWQNFLEESIEEEGNKRKKQIDLLKATVTSEVEAQKNESNAELSEIKMRLAYALGELERLKTDNQNIQGDIESLSSTSALQETPPELSITSVLENAVTKAPVSSFNHLPATSYVSGHLLGGIAVSTAVGSSSEPIPVVIKLTDKGNLPKNFAVDIKACRLLGSCYGDISSERAIIRAEELVCENKKSGLIVSTKVAGVIYGDDGANGIRGTVVSMSDKHLKNAVIGGILSGFSNTAKGQDGFDITSIGSLHSKKQGAQEMAKDGILGGMSSASEKLANYHIKLAENISPVILVPGGTKVDVMFTKSVEIGSFDIETAIGVDRNKVGAKNHAE